MYKKLLVPVDGTDLSDSAIRSSLALAKHLGASITAFIAEPLAQPSVEGRPPQLEALERERHAARTEEHAASVLARYEAQAREAGVGFEGHHTRTDQVEVAIAEAAKEYGCDLIVMATHGGGAFNELVFGSHTKRVMSRTKTPLLVLH